MYILSVHIKNYKSFLDSNEINLSPEINIIVGENNTGKTALLEAIAMRINTKPHKSIYTLPTTDQVINIPVEIVVYFQISRKEFFNELNKRKTFYIPTINNLDTTLKTLQSAIQDTIKLIYHYYPDGTDYAHLELYPYDRQGRSDIPCTALEISSSNIITVKNHNINHIRPEDEIMSSIARYFRESIYIFKAERLNISRSAMGADPILLSDARNLSQVLNLLQANPSRFSRLNSNLRTIFPQITQITAPPISQTESEILVWSVDPQTERSDLAVPLSESGTGIGQVLAILYVILTSDLPRTIIIDEPQSFLHPGAIRKLFDILKQHPQHQYIITTHSPIALNTIIPKTLLLLRKVDAETTIESLNINETQQIRSYLAEIGARLSDVFGADNILWVEGPTEERCFTLIVNRLLKQPLYGTEILGVKHTGDFEGKQAQTVFDIYDKLSRGRNLLPPAIGFIFDREDRSETSQQDLIRQSGGTVHFLKRRMYENYLLNPNALATALNLFDINRQTSITPADISNWFTVHQWERDFISKTDEQNRTDEHWRREVHGAKLLKHLFTHFTEQRVQYEKVSHGEALTGWLIEHTPNELDEITGLLKKVLPT